MMNCKSHTAIIIICAVYTCISSAHAQMPKELSFGIITTESTQTLRTSFAPFLKDMSKSIGITVKPFFAKDYAGIIQGMRRNSVDVAWFGNKSAMEAVDTAGGEVFCQTMNADGSPGYWSILITHKDSKINSLSDVLKCDQSLSFGNGDPNSTSGFLVPSYYVFAQNSIDPKGCFKSVSNAAHETNAIAVAEKRVDIATNNTDSLARLKRNHPKAAAMIKEIWRSPLIPSDPIVWRKNLDEEAKNKIYRFFLQYGRAGNAKRIMHERKVLAGLDSGWAPFEASSDLQLIPIRQMRAFRDKLKLQSNTTMPPEEKSLEIRLMDNILKNLNELSAAAAFH